MEYFHLKLEDLQALTVCSHCKSSRTIVKKVNQIAVKGHRYSLHECLDCGFWFSPTRDAQTIDYKSYDQNLESRDEDYIAKRYFDKLRHIEFSKYQSVIEIGCARGHFINLIKKSHPHLEVGGLELNEKMCAIARTSGIDCFQSPQEHQGKFDLILANHVIEHFDHPFEFIDIFRQLGHKKHAVVLNFPNKDNIWTKRGLYPDLHVPFHRFYYSVKEITKLLIKEGYTILEAGSTEDGRYLENLKQSRYNHFRGDLGLFKHVASNFESWDSKLDQTNISKIEEELGKKDLGSEAFIFAAKLS
ncbi:class I SAM-dependent methyltransferase [bacterium]|nr:class I SAM-dependent methyltransferase [bacterium]